MTVDDEHEDVTDSQYEYVVLDRPEPCAVCGEPHDSGVRDEQGLFTCESCAEEEGIL